MGWDWSYFFTYIHSGYILSGVWVTVWLTVVSLLGGLVIGVLMALISQSTLVPLKSFYFAYTNLIRGTPLLVQLVFVYSALPQIGIELSVVTSAIVALVANESAYIAEIARSAIASVDPGQTEAAKALGMGYWKSMRVIILPQAARVAIPPLGNEVNGLLKNTSLVSIISMRELFRSVEQLTQSSFKVLELLAIATIYYLVLTGAWALLQRVIEQRLSNHKARRRNAARPIVFAVGENA